MSLGAIGPDVTGTMPTISRRWASLASGALLVFATSRALCAQSLTLDAALATARRNHPALAGASARRQETVGAVRQRAALPNPFFEWRYENLGSPLAPDVFLTVTQPLGISGRRAALRSEASKIDERALADSVTTLRAVEAEVVRAFWLASLARGLRELATELRVDAERLAQSESARAREGAVSELSAMRMRVEADRARVAESTARAEWARAAAELTRALGVPAGELPDVEPLSLATTTPAVPSVSAALTSALARRSELHALRANVEAARRRLSAERRGAVPDLSLVAGTKRTAGLDTRVVGVSMPFPFLDRNAGARASATGALRLAESELRAGEQTVRAEVIGALESLRALVEAQDAGVDSLATRAEEVARIAEAAYAAGGGSLLDLLDARRLRADALTAALRRASELRLARLELNRASGLPLLDLSSMP